MENKVIEIRRKRAELLDEARKLADGELTDEVRAKVDELMTLADTLEKDAQREERLARLVVPKGAPNLNQLPLGDSEERAFAHWLKTGDDGGIRELRASNATSMNITTAEDGGYAVPTGHYQGIIARRDEGMLALKLGVRRIPGKGTTVNIPVDNEDDGEFVSTAESSENDQDAPAITQVPSTLVKYTKRIDLTVELLEDEDSAILNFLNDFVGRGLAKTHNSLLLTEVAANGTSLKTFASATVIAVGEPENIVYADALDPYLDDGGSVGWVMRRSVHGEIIGLGSTSIPYYRSNPFGDAIRPTLLEFPVLYSYKSGATAASTKSVYFGNWNYVGYREAPGMTVIRDPYARAAYGEIRLHYMFRCDYNVLVAEAIGYGVHPSA